MISIEILKFSISLERFNFKFINASTGELNQCWEKAKLLKMLKNLLSRPFNWLHFSASTDINHVNVVDDYFAS